jgi:hypothetical protein
MFGLPAVPVGVGCSALRPFPFPVNLSYPRARGATSDEKINRRINTPGVTICLLPRSLLHVVRIALYWTRTRQPYTAARAPTPRFTATLPVPSPSISPSILAPHPCPHSVPASARAPDHPYARRGRRAAEWHDGQADDLSKSARDFSSTCTCIRRMVEAAEGEHGPLHGRPCPPP